MFLKVATIFIVYFSFPYVLQNVPVVTICWVTFFALCFLIFLVLSLCSESHCACCKCFKCCRESVLPAGLRRRSSSDCGGGNLTNSLMAQSLVRGGGHPTGGGALAGLNGNGILVPSGVNGKQPPLGFGDTRGLSSSTSKIHSLNQEFYC